MQKLEVISGVYALLDPDNGDIRYIGQSKDINKRIKRHCQNVTGFPISRWVQKLKRNNKSPDLIIIEEHDNPLLIEKMWIDRAKAQGVKLLNLHEGGKYPSHAHKAKNKKLWNVDGLKTPYKLLWNRCFSLYQRNEIVNKLFKDFSKERRACKNDEQVIDFELKMAYVAGTFKDLDDPLNKWFAAVEASINNAYPNKIKLIYANS